MIVKTKTLLTMLLAILSLFANGSKVSGNKNSPAAISAERNYCKADGKNYLESYDEHVSVVPASFFISDGETITTSKPLGKAAKHSPISIVYYLVKYQDITEALDFSITYKNQAHEFRKSKISVSPTVKEIDSHPEGTIKVKTIEYNVAKAYSFVFTPLETDGDIYINNISLSLAKPAVYSRACIYKGALLTPDPYLFFEQEVTADEDMKIVKANASVDIEADARKPIPPAKVLDLVAVYDEETQRSYRTIGLFWSLEMYAEQLDLIEAGYFVKIQLMATTPKLAIVSVTLKYEDEDTTPPTITVDGQTTGANVDLSYKDAKDERTVIQKLVSKVKITDDRGTGLMPDIKIENFEIGKLATYKLTVTANDGINKATWQGTVSIIDDVAPKVSGPKIINASATTPLLQEEILSYYSAIDEIDGEELEFVLTDNEYGIGQNSVTAGNYSLKVNAVDKAKNKGTLAVVIKVEEDDNGTWFIDGATLTIVEGAKLSPMEIVRRLVDVGTIEDLDYRKATITKGPLMDGTLKPGEYEIAVRADTAQGETRLIEMVIKVLAKNKPKKDGQANWFIQFWCDLWGSIVGFFKDIFGAD